MSTRLRDARWILILISVFVILGDRWSKLAVASHIKLGQHVEVIPRTFWISHVLNTGAAFSMFEGSNSPFMVRGFLIGFSVIASIIVLVVLWRVGREFSMTSVALALILGGAIGNLYDRWHLRYVIDFLEVHIHGYHWPDFNVADSAIVVGACLLLLEMLRPQKSGGN